MTNHLNKYSQESLPYTQHLRENVMQKGQINLMHCKMKQPLCKAYCSELYSALGAKTHFNGTPCKTRTEPFGFTIRVARVEALTEVLLRHTSFGDATGVPGQGDSFQDTVTPLVRHVTDSRHDVSFFFAQNSPQPGSHEC